MGSKYSSKIVVEQSWDSREPAVVSYWHSLHPLW